MVWGVEVVAVEIPEVGVAQRRDLIFPILEVAVALAEGDHVVARSAHVSVFALV